MSTPPVVPYKDSEKSKKEQVADMFDNVAPTYDRLNRILSLGIDISWRNKVKKELRKQSPDHVLDLATGTGDLAFSIYRKGMKITAGDISEGMMDQGREKAQKKQLENAIKFKYCDAENLPFEQSTFDAITIAFGVRNFQNLEAGLADMFRVLKPGGMAYILEFSKPRKGLFGSIFLWYSKNILPKIGKLLSKDNAAYQYLPDSIEVFPSGNQFAEIMKAQGFDAISVKPLTFGVSTLYIGKKA